MDQGDDTGGWAALAAQASLSAHQLIGWIDWDPEAIAGHAALGVPNGAGYYIASRAAPPAPAGNSAVVAAFYSVSPLFIAEPAAARLMHRIDATAGPAWMPAARPSRRRPTEPA